MSTRTYNRLSGGTYITVTERPSSDGTSVSLMMSAHGYAAATTVESGDVDAAIESFTDELVDCEISCIESDVGEGVDVEGKLKSAADAMGMPLSRLVTAFDKACVTWTADAFTAVTSSLCKLTEPPYFLSDLIKHLGNIERKKPT